ncbi:MAG: cupin domain-containing protein [Desulfobacterales bacterium]
MDDSITYQTVVVLNVSRLSGKEYKERGQNLNSEKTILNDIFSKLKTVCSLANAQEVTKPMTPSVSRKDLLTAMVDSDKSVSRVEVKEVTMGPKQKAPLHLHPCPTVGVITEGTISFQIEGQPVQHLKIGDAFYEPANVRVAKFDNDSNTPAKFVVFYLLGEGENENVRILSQ